jgi:hypothetical protein
MLHQPTNHIGTRLRHKPAWRRSGQLRRRASLSNGAPSSVHGCCVSVIIAIFGIRAVNAGKVWDAGKVCCIGSKEAKVRLIRSRSMLSRCFPSLKDNHRGVSRLSSLSSRPRPASSPRSSLFYLFYVYFCCRRARDKNFRPSALARSRPSSSQLFGANALMSLVLYMCICILCFIYSSIRDDIRPRPAAITRSDTVCHTRQPVHSVSDALAAPVGGALQNLLCGHTSRQLPIPPKNKNRVSETRAATAPGYFYPLCV